MSDENLKETEAPTTGQSAPAGGKDPHKEAAREAEKAEGAVADGTAQGAPAFDPVTHRENVTDKSTTSGEPAEEAGDQGGEETRQPTPEEQAELDAMVDYTIKEGDIEKMPEDVREKFLAGGGKVGDTIKVAKDHPFLADGAGDQG
ncbi:MAG: hypothetical protein Tp172MES00d2C118482111_17 [Prokaryotic dsDNA virus sp.]|nr:MAG: hypothetical protein Tp172MES00d2C118482111_17 [Prokaryotic dsDNA virus sp.]|tara:strand:- start:3486 stop:3923 length:438 start_codon:yes stop_codon:yes gene_type:complete